ncbi:MAG TPA: immunoglobulin domain-containing protein, partial [Verrucomicrobiae bacterium]|nr:immunoglobulin domain-containing protein [Verrucomicrobiae bacterium]
PASQTVNYASPASFSVAATGVPNPTYQWIKDGTNLTGATSATVNIASAALTDGGSYSVVVTTPAGSVTSSPAVLTVNPPSNTAPVFTAPIGGTNLTINVGVNLAVACTATDSDTPAQTLTYTLLTGPSGAAVGSSSGTLTWRPTVPQAGSVNNLAVVATDNGTPNLSATNLFTVAVNALSAPAMASSAYVGGQFSVSVSGQVGPDYALQATTNLVSGTWTTVVATNSPAAVPFSLTDTNAAAQPMQFYRIVTGPPLP